MRGDEHISVLLNEAVDALAIKRGGRYVDGTFGRGGHSRAIASRGGEVLGIDRDDDAIAFAATLPEVKRGAIRVVKGTHANLRRIANENGWNEVDGVLLDLGVSSPQLDEAERGFSFLREGPLDMRMDRSAGLTASELLASSSVDELTGIFRTYGEEPHARRIAAAIAEHGRFSTTTELADFIERLVGRHGGKHPATRVFQALRMSVNNEVAELAGALQAGLDLLAAGGRMAVIAFESITDRVVKEFLTDHVGKMQSLQQGGSQWRGALPRVKWVVHKPAVAGEEELRDNPRSRSAKLRAVERSEE